jgi:ABC-type branched-subunit amino acid transport system substrate-binding protein
LDAVQAAVTDRKLMGHPIRLDRQSTDCTSESAQLAAIELTLDPDLVAVIGPTCETEKQVALPILLDAGIPALSPVPDAGAAGDLLEQLFTCIQQVAVRGSDGSLSIPRQALLKALNISP